MSAPARRMAGSDETPKHIPDRLAPCARPPRHSQPPRPRHPDLPDPDRWITAAAGKVMGGSCATIYSSPEATHARPQASTISKRPTDLNSTLAASIDRCCAGPVRALPALSGARDQLTVGRASQTQIGDVLLEPTLGPTVGLVQGIGVQERVPGHHTEISPIALERARVAEGWCATDGINLSMAMRKLLTAWPASHLHRARA